MFFFSKKTFKRTYGNDGGADKRHDKENEDADEVSHVKSES